MASAKITALVVDDNPHILSLEREILEREGFMVLQASNGEDALDIIAANPLSLVLLDVTLPNMDGLTVCQQVRKFSQVPIFVLTGRPSEEGRVRALELGADDYVTKPFSVKELVVRVRAVLRQLDG